MDISNDYLSIQTAIDPTFGTCEYVLLRHHFFMDYPESDKTNINEWFDFEICYQVGTLRPLL